MEATWWNVQMERSASPEVRVALAPIMGATGRPCTRIEQDVSALMAIGSPGEGHYIAEEVGPALAIPFCPAKCISS